MTIKELINELRQFDQDTLIKVEVNVFSNSTAEYVDECIEDVVGIRYEKQIENDIEYLAISTTIYQD